MSDYLKKILNFKIHNSGKSSDFNSVNKKVFGLYDPNRIYGLKPVLCKAPFVNMFFDVTGKVHACCLSWKCSDDILKKNISQIWKGEKFNSLRTRIKKNDLTFACDICNSYIKSKNPHLALISMFNDFFKFNDEYPVIMEFELSNTCNLECIMCNKNFSSSIRKNRDKLPPMQCYYNDDFIEQIEKYIPHLEEARFIGGEPFLIEIYYKIWEKIISINPEIKISVSTNGTVLNDRIKEILRKGKFEIVFSIDSIDKTNYENIRKNASFDKVINNLNFFHNYCFEKGTFFNIAVCPIQQNWEELPKLVKFCNNLQAYLFFNTVIEPFECALWSLSGNQLNEIQTYLEKQILYDNSETVIIHNNIRFRGLINQINVWKEKSFKREKAVGLSTSAEFEKSKAMFLKNLKNFINKTDKLNPEDKKQKIAYCIETIDKVLCQLPIYINRNYLFSLLNNIEIKLVVENLVNSNIESLVYDAKSMITNHFYNFEL